MDLAGLSVQVEEFTDFGELTYLNKYLKKAQALNTKLEAATEKVNEQVDAARSFSGVMVLYVLLPPSLS